MNYLLLDNINNYYPFVILLAFVLYYIFYNSISSIIILLIGVYLGFMINNIFKEYKFI
jgi:hypothetical protein